LNIKVAVAVIFNEEGKVLITRRPIDAPHGGMWEFPGGKLEENEAPVEALMREVKEEVGVNILSYSFLGQINHSYEVKSVNLLVFCVHKYEGTACCLESQMDLRWVDLVDLSQYSFPKANIKIIELLDQHE
jgi:8-oxo-dGTP diphosphatase